MKTLVLGASGATGSLLVEQLLSRHELLKIIIRPQAQIPPQWAEDQRVHIIRAELLSLSVDEMAEHLADCRAVVSCLGHKLTLKGIFGPPRKLVRRAVQLVAAAIIKNSPVQPLKLVLMNTAGNHNPGQDENLPALHKLALAFLRLLLPPQADNEEAAAFLSHQIGRQHPLLEWVVLRPDSLLNRKFVSQYEVHLSPLRSALFNPGQSSRINVANFMARLLLEDELWRKWRGHMPVIYDSESIAKE